MKLQGIVTTSFQRAYDLPSEARRRRTVLQGDVTDVKKETKSLAVNPTDDLLEDVNARPVFVGRRILEGCSKLPLTSVFHGTLSTRHVVLNHFVVGEGCVFHSLKGIKTHEVSPNP